MRYLIILTFAITGCVTNTQEKPEQQCSYEVKTSSLYQSESLETLHRLLQVARERDFSLKKAELLLEIAKASYDNSISKYYPTLTLENGISRERVGSAVFSSVIGENAKKPTDSSIYLGNVITQWEIDLFGKNRLLKKQSKEKMLALAESVYAQELLVESLVAHCYFTCVQLAERENILKELGEVLSQVKEIEVNSIDCGFQKTSDLSNIDKELLYQKQRLYAVEDQKRKTVADLAILLDSSYESTLSVISSEEKLPFLDVFSYEYTSVNLRNRPDVLKLEHEFLSAMHGSELAFRSLFPSLSFSSTFGLISSSLQSFFRGESFAYSVGASSVSNLFDGWLSRNNVNISKKNEEIAFLAYKQGVNKAILEVDTNIEQTCNLQKSYLASISIEEENKRKYNELKLLYTSGIANKKTIINAHIEFLESKQERALKLYQYLISLVILNKSLGGN